jgi:hypothetical protein
MAVRARLFSRAIVLYRAVQFVVNAQHLAGGARAQQYATHAVHVDWLLQHISAFVERVADPKVG